MKHILFGFFLFLTATLTAQQSSKSKSRDRFREKDDGHYPVRVSNSLEINHEGADYAPAFFKEGIVFVSNRDKNGPRDPKTGEPYAKLFYAFFDYNGDPGIPQKVAFSESGAGSMNEGPLCFSRDNNTVFQTRNNNKDGVIKSGPNGKSTLKIYESHRKRGKQGYLWTPPAELPFDSDDYSCMHPGLSADGSKLFFSSDMPGGYGGYDLYYSERVNDTWSAPVNLGPLINTAKQEIFPFISQAGTLFFTSNGRSATLGGFDIYYVNNPLNDPEEVVDLGDQINSEADDMAFISNDDGKKGFFTSNRARGAGKDDIYFFEAPHGLEGVAKPRTSDAQIIVTDAATGAPLQKAAIRILQSSDDGFVNGKKDAHSFDLTPVPETPGAFSLQLIASGEPGAADLYSNAEGKARTEFIRYRNYLVVVSLEGYDLKEKMVPVRDENAVSVQFGLNRKANLAQGSVPGADSLPAIRNIREGSTIILDKIHFERNGTALDNSAVDYLDAVFEVLQSFPEMEIDLVAHTDTRGDARLNQELTDARAQNAKTYLVRKGIDANRIRAFGKGESEPRNRCAEGVDCSDGEHQQNNRLEVRIRKVGRAAGH